jgi:hypothetical protein
VPGHTGGAPALVAESTPIEGASVLDVVYLAATIVLIALVAMIARGVEKL